MKPSTIITNRFGKERLSLLNLMGLVLLFTFFSNYLYSLQSGLTFRPLSFLLLILALGLCFSCGGIKLDPEKKRYKNYFSLLWANLGFWKSLDTYKELVLLRGKPYKPYSLFDKPENPSQSEIIYELHLSSADHLNLLMVKQVCSREKAEENAKLFARIMRIDWVKYNPGNRRPRKVLAKGDT